MFYDFYNSSTIKVTFETTTVAAISAITIIVTSITTIITTLLLLWGSFGQPNNGHRLRMQADCAQSVLTCHRVADMSVLLLAMVAAN